MVTVRTIKVRPNRMGFFGYLETCVKKYCFDSLSEAIEYINTLDRSEFESVEMDTDPYNFQ